MALKYENGARLVRPAASMELIQPIGRGATIELKSEWRKDARSVVSRYMNAPGDRQRRQDTPELRIGGQSPVPLIPLTADAELVRREDTVAIEVEPRELGPV